MGCGVSVPPELPYHSSSLYNGKVLEPLPAANEKQVKKFQCGVWSDVMPDQLRPVIQRPETYRDAIGLINTVSQTQVRFKSYWTILLIAVVLSLLVAFTGIGIPLLILEPVESFMHSFKTIGIPWIVVLKILLCYLSGVRNERLRIVAELQKTIGQANVLLSEEKVLIGSKCNSKLFLAHVFLDGCRLELSALSQNNAFFHKAILDYSCDYTCCLAKRHFPFKPISNTCHLEGALCFCQYVICRLSRKRLGHCCREEYSIPPLMISGIDNPTYV